MIGKLKGIIDSYGEDWTIIDVGGVGYHVFCSAKTLASLPGVGEAGEVFVETLVSQDAITLVGFSSGNERDWFRLLKTVQGVGTKVALAILSTISASELVNAIAVGDKAMVTQAPGVGPKVAQRIITELKDKAPAFAPADLGLAGLAVAMDAPTPTAAGDAVSALTNLGYGQTQAGAAVSAVLAKAGDDPKTEVLIRLALKELAGV